MAVRIAHISDMHVGSVHFVPNLMNRVITELNLVLDPQLAHSFTKAYWALAQRPGRVIAAWQQGFAVELRLSLREGTLSGIGYYTNDVGSTRHTSVRAVRVTCPETLGGLPPNQRMKLPARGGRLGGNGPVLSATVAGRSLSAIS